MQKLQNTSRSMLKLERATLKVGKHCKDQFSLGAAEPDSSTGLDNLYSHFTRFHDTLNSISDTAINIANSHDRREHARETKQIINMVADCRSIVIRMLDVSGKFKKSEESPSSFKLAVHSWVYDQNGKEKIDGMINEIKDLTFSIAMTLIMINT
jgi:hypothetical protein